MPGGRRHDASFEGQVGAVPLTSPADRLLGYLDLFGRLDDDELSRLARVPRAVVLPMRERVESAERLLGRYADLADRLSDQELSALSGADPTSVRFWRACRQRPVPSASPRETSLGAAQDRYLSPPGGTVVPRDQAAEEELELGIVVDDTEERESPGYPRTVPEDDDFL
jgi:hypothetical protein